MWIYPPIEDTVIEGREHLSYNVFNTTVSRKAFCRHCGVHICNEPNPLTGEQTCLPNHSASFVLFCDFSYSSVSCAALINSTTLPPDAEIEALSDAAKGWRERAMNLRPITLRVLDDFDFKTIQTRRMDGWGIIKPLYVNP